MEGKFVLEVDDLTKMFNGFKAVDQLSFRIDAKECVGILGPNGAGKTTTIKMLYGTAEPSGGTIKIFSEMFAKNNRRRIKQSIGIMPQELNLDTDLSVYENLSIYARYFGLRESVSAPRIEELLRFFKLEEKSSRHIDSLSGGMKRRLMLARALINEPALLILDEPTTGLDPQARHAIWERLRELRSQGITQILTTHYMDEAEFLCDRIIIMDKGKIVIEGNPGDLIKETIGTEVIHITTASPIEAETLAHSFIVDIYHNEVYFYGADEQEARRAIIASGGDMVEFRQRRTTLEDLFLHLTGRRLRE